MFQTFKLCNMRDCHAHDVEPVPFDVVNPCQVFWHEETNMWYHELTGGLVNMHQHGDGQIFDVQAWLTGQAQDAMTIWDSKKTKVHEAYKRHLIPSGQTRPIARPPQYTCDELDAIGDNFIRTRKDRKEILDEIQDLGRELHGFSRMQKKWNSNALLDGHITDLRERRDALRTIQSDMDKGANVARYHLKNENDWTNRWSPKKGNWDDFVLVWEDPKSKALWVIDCNGLKLRGHYFYLPDMDKAYFESANYAQKELGIKPGEWKKFRIPAEKIGAPLRRYGKKNVNGQRISARYDQKRYAETCIEMVKFMWASGVNPRKFGRDDELYQYYLDNIAPRLNRG
jgi:hypothetical protein